MKKGKLIILSLAVLSVASIGATWAAWADHEQTRNEYRIPEYKTKLEETFTPEENWQPGIETQKEVWVSNIAKEGDGVPVVTKVVIDQRWEEHETGKRVDLIFESPASAEQDGKKLKEYAALPHFTDDVYLLASGAIPEGSEEEGLKLGLSVVEDDSLMDLSDPDAPKINPDMAKKWILMDENPDIPGRFVLYYLGVIQPGESTVPFLESVRMNPLLEPELVKKETSYEKLPDGTYQWTTKESPSQLSENYEDCRYTMEIHALTVQATKDAVEEALFKNRRDADVNERVMEHMIAIADDNVYDAALTSEKRLKIERSGNNRFTYTPYQSENGEIVNRFMSFTEMLPGGTYYDTMVVENTTSSGLDLFMQILPTDSSSSELTKKTQDALADELLQMIQMKVWMQTDASDGSVKENLVYDGTARGYQVKTDGGNLAANVVSLCRVPARDSVKVRVELRLSPELTLDATTADPNTGETVAQLTGKTYRYADVLSEIDWHFWVQRTGGGGGDDDDPPGGGGGEEYPPGDPVPIDDPGVPLEEFIPDPEIPLAYLLPETGDTTPILLLGIGALLCLTALAGLGMAYRKAGKEEKNR